MKKKVFFFALFGITNTFANYPFISIITSLYNGDLFIEGFLEDITRQTIFNQCELIIINANSPGNEEKTINKYMELYPNIVYIRLDKDPGLYGVWNLAIQLSKGAFITNANVDDRLHYQCYEIHMNELINNPEIDLVYSGYHITHIPNETFQCHTRTRTIDFPEFSVRNMYWCLPGNHPMWRRSLHDKWGYFDEAFKSAGDWDLWMKMVTKGSLFKKVPGIMGLLYETSNCLSQREFHKTEKNKILAQYKDIFSQYKYNYNEVCSSKKRLYNTKKSQ